MIMEIPLLNKYFEETIEVKDARLRDQCTMKSVVFCDCTHNLQGRLHYRSLLSRLQ